MKRIEKFKFEIPLVNNTNIVNELCRVRNTINQLIENQNQLDDKLNEIIDRLNTPIVIDNTKPVHDAKFIYKDKQ